ncbi:lipase [Novosphingobium sp. Rr 2-17]|uniref:alpha/beta hydrolase n=1 Tax=Novosphingobium sp. Rr 2-17 TaxID=555793 RepID=UPI0002698B9F|nr:alpha/beta hydrolase [Novosphingobium sp. Rr 2-17]EIZ80070.1 lipase [Novosphingobium sp. Rr 2-17]
MTNVFSIGLTALVCLATASAAAAQTPAPQVQTSTGKGPKMPDFEHPVGKQFTFPDFVSPQLKAQYPGNVEATFGLTYATITGVRPLKLDVYRVPNMGPKPAIIFVHGGSYVNGDPKNDRNPIFGENDGFMAYVASRGYVVIPVTYRLADEGKWPSQLEDVKAAIRWVRGNAAKYGVDPQRIGVWGESAGGHIAAMIGATCGIKEFDEQKDQGIYGNPARGVQAKFADQSSCVQAAVAWSATTDFAQLDPQSASFARLVHNTPASSQSRVLGCALGTTCSSATVERANVLHYVNQGGASKTAFLLAAGTRDEATPWQQSQELYDGLRKRGVPAQLELVRDADHYFIGASKEQSKEILDTFFEFIQRYLG